MKKQLFRKATVIVLSAGLLAMSLTACGNSKVEENTSSNPSEPQQETAEVISESEQEVSVENIEDYHYTGEKLTIVLGDLPSCFPFGIAKEKGFLDEVFEGDNVEFEFNIIQGSGATVAQALAADEADFGMLGEQPAIARIAAGYDIKIIGKNQNSTSFYPLYATKESGVTSVEGLKGKKVGVAFGTSNHYLTIAYLHGVGLSEKDVEIVQTTDVLTLLISGEIDAAIVLQGQSKTIEAEGAIRLCDESDFSITQESVLAVRTEFAEQYPELTAKFLLALQKADDWIAENRDETCRIASERSQFDVVVEEGFYDNNNVEVNLQDSDIESLEGILQFLKDYELLADNSIIIDDIVDLQYLELAGLR